MMKMMISNPTRFLVRKMAKKIKKQLAGGKIVCEKQNYDEAEKNVHIKGNEPMRFVSQFIEEQFCWTVNEIENQ